MLTQLHHQYEDRTEFIAQKDINSRKEQDMWIRKMKKEFHLPEGAQWMLCTEESRHFVSTHKETTDDLSTL